jgi:hypothetical protein
MNDNVLYILEKSRAKQYIKVIIDPKGDDWFIYFQWIEKKTDKIKSECIVIRKDIPDWISHLTGSLGWKIKEKIKT